MGLDPPHVSKLLHNCCAEVFFHHYLGAFNLDIASHGPQGIPTYHR
jgi:hypothetical protein